MVALPVPPPAGQTKHNQPPTGNGLQDSPERMNWHAKHSCLESMEMEVDADALFIDDAFYHCPKCNTVWLSHPGRSCCYDCAAMLCIFQLIRKERIRDQVTNAGSHLTMRADRARLLL